jgi:threonine dehydratase
VPAETTVSAGCESALDLPTFADVVAAAGRLASRALCTPVLRSDRFDQRVGRAVLFKCENLQHVGAFKYRGAMNALLQLPTSAARIVATHSSGNHGAALARAARELGWRCIVVAPTDASPVKLAAIKAEGAELRACAPGLVAREAALAEVIAATGAVVIHPFDDARVIAGQGTAALELLAAYPDLQVLTAPVGGGGLLSGTAIATRAMQPAAQVIGVEPEVADDAARSMRSGQRIALSGSPPTIADGLRGSIGARPFELFRRHVDEVLTVSEAAIIAAMRTVLEDFRLLIEPSSAVPVAALLEGRIGQPGSRIGVIISGGNVDLSGCPYLAGSLLAS